MNTLLIIALLSGNSFALENGLARTPPMGWLTWERFRCQIDCLKHPNDCISENLIKTTAKAMVNGGFLAAGYEYIIIDDCWLAKNRTYEGKLQPDAIRFPSGIKNIADYVHSLGLKLGIYEDFGTHTCGGYPGSEYHLESDANTFAEWGVDYLKLDGCYSIPAQYNDAYPAMGFWLNRTGRPMVYSCSWPAYMEPKEQPNYPRLSKACNIARNTPDVQDSWSSVAGTIEFYGKNEGNFAEVAQPGFFNDPDMPNYKRIAKHCNVWRNYADIQDSWASLSNIIDFFGDNVHKFIEVAGPGHFNDPDMLIIGNFGLSRDQARVQMALWSIMASPLIMSTDLRTIDPVSKALLQNAAAIQINQDPLGKQGRRIKKIGNVQVWVRQLQGGAAAFAFLNGGTDGAPSDVSVRLSDLGLNHPSGYRVREVFEGKSYGNIGISTLFTVSVNPTAVILKRGRAGGGVDVKGEVLRKNHAKSFTIE